MNDYLTTYHGRDLLKKHSLTETGTWNVYGEDPNCDMGGAHIQPFLGTFDGALQDVIDLAVTLPSFWQWGSGGRIDKISVKRVKSGDAKRRSDLLLRIQTLEDEVKTLKAQL